MHDKQLPALPEPYERRFPGALGQLGEPVSGLYERPASMYPSTEPAGQARYYDGEPGAPPPSTSSYLGSSFALAPLASFTSASTISEQASMPMGDSVMPLSSTPTQAVSQARTSGAPTLSVALPSPYLLMNSSNAMPERAATTEQLAQGLPAAQAPVHATPHLPTSTSAYGVYGGAPVPSIPTQEPALIEAAALTPAAPAPTHSSACEEPANVAVEPPVSEDWAAGLVQPCLLIEHRATWLQTELLITFSAKQAEPVTAASGGGGLASTMLVPRVAPDTAGRFRVWLATQAPTKATHMHLLWDRKTEGGFPELKELKRRVRDKIAPAQHLGHSDKL